MLGGLFSPKRDVALHSLRERRWVAHLQCPQSKRPLRSLTISSTSRDDQPVSGTIL